MEPLKKQIGQSISDIWKELQIKIEVSVTN